MSHPEPWKRVLSGRYFHTFNLPPEFRIKVINSGYSRNFLGFSVDSSTEFNLDNGLKRAFLCKEKVPLERWDILLWRCFCHLSPHHDLRSFTEAIGDLRGISCSPGTISKNGRTTKETAVGAAACYNYKNGPAATN